MMVPSIAIFGMMLTIIILLAGYIYLEKTTGSNSKKSSSTINNYDINSQIIKTVNLKKMIGIRSVKNNIISSEDGNLSCIIDVSTPEFGLMTTEDQTLYENRLIELIFKLSFSMKIITIVRNKNLNNVIEALETFRNNIQNESLISYSQSFQEELIKEQNNKTIKKYYVIYTKEKGDYEDKLKELQKKASTFINGMSAVGCRTRIITTNESLELLNTLTKKYDKLDMRVMEGNNVFDIAI